MISTLILILLVRDMIPVLDTPDEKILTPVGVLKEAPTVQR